jgi:hypothetical protein
VPPIQHTNNDTEVLCIQEAPVMYLKIAINLINRKTNTQGYKYASCNTNMSYFLTSGPISK